MTAPHVTAAQLDAAIASEEFYVFPKSGVTVCVLTLKNGCVSTGEALEGGLNIARSSAYNKLWALEKYAAASKAAGL